MNRRAFNAFCSLGLPLGLLGASGAARAQGWPERPVRLVLSQPPGSGPDNVARILSDRLTKDWRQAVVIENKPGGQNTIGAQAAARSPADGHTFYFATTAALVTNRFLFKQLPYDPLKDFTPVAFVGRSPFGILVSAHSPLRTLEDLVARAQAEPGRLALGNEGPRTFGGMIARLFNVRADLKANLVSYASVGVSLQDLIGGHVDAVVGDLASSVQLVKQGRLRLLATTTAERVPGWEKVPTLAERLPGFDMVGWFAVVAPAGTPPEAVGRFSADLRRLLAERDVAERIATIGPIADASMDAERLGGFLRKEHERWAQITKEIGVLPE